MSHKTEKAYALFVNVESKTEYDRRLTELPYRTGLCYYSLMNHDKAIEEFQKAVDYLQKEIEIRKQSNETPEQERALNELTEMHADISQKIVDVKETKEMVWNFTFFLHSPMRTGFRTHFIVCERIQFEI